MLVHEYQQKIYNFIYRRVRDRELMSRELRTPILWLLALIYVSLVGFML